MNRPLPPPPDAAATGRPTLADSTLFIERALVGDAWIAADSGETLTVVSPTTGEPVGTIPALGQAETARAVAAAEIAFDRWKRKTAGERDEPRARPHRDQRRRPV